MRGISAIRRMIAGLMAVVLLATLVPMGASAQVEIINADLGACRSNITSYSVQLQSGDSRAPLEIYPASVTLYFADGTTGTATPWLATGGGSQTYTYSPLKNVNVTGATAEWDTAAYPNYRFTVTARPCYPAVVSGTIVQNGNQKPVADLTVCLEELGLCTTTDAAGYFAFSNVEFGNYTLTSNGNNWKPASTTVRVITDTHLNLVQFKGGGNGN